jgi:hypothetical protein
MAKKGDAHEGGGKGRKKSVGSFNFGANARPKKSAGGKRKSSGIRIWHGQQFGS